MKDSCVAFLLSIIIISGTAAQNGPEVLWSNYYYPPDLLTVCYSVQQTADAGFIIGGKVLDQYGMWSSIYLCKTDQNGDTLWTNSIAGPDLLVDNITVIQIDDGYIISARSYGNNWD